MYTRPAATVGLASSSGAGFPVITGGCQCHTWLADAAFDGVNAVAGLTELCCGSCRNCGQSRLDPAADAVPAAPAGASSNAPDKANTVGSFDIHARKPDLDIAHPPINAGC